MKRSKWMSVVLSSVIAVLPVISACSVDAVDQKEATATTGTVSMALSSSTNGNTYRLNNAVFTIQGPAFTQLDSSSDPMESVLTAVLPTGDYTSTLEPGWSLQRNDGGSFVTVDASLISGNPVAFTLSDGQTTSLVYQFNTNGTIITIGTGQLDISIQVNETTGGMCQPFGTGCQMGQWCVPASLVGSDQCVASGSTPVGAPCADPFECTTNAICASTGGSDLCIELCSTANFGLSCPGGGLVCQDVGFPDLGACL